MRTVRDIVNHAFYSVGVGRVGQDLDAGTFRFGLSTFNEMLDLWRSQEIPHGYANVTADDVVYDGALSSAFRKNLAILVLEAYGLPPQPTLLRDAIDEKDRLVAFDPTLEYDSALEQKRWLGSRFLS